MTSRISGISLVARPINCGPRAGCCGDLRVEATNLRESTPRAKFGQIVPAILLGDRLYRVPGQDFTQYFRDGRKRVAHAARNYRPYLKSGDSYLFGEEERSSDFGSRSINYFSLLPLPFDLSPHVRNSSEKSIKPMAEAKRPCICLRFRHQSRVLVATVNVSVNYA